jgi:hypothetical protein
VGASLELIGHANGRAPNSRRGPADERDDQWVPSTGRRFCKSPLKAAGALRAARRAIKVEASLSALAAAGFGAQGADPSAP